MLYVQDFINVWGDCIGAAVVAESDSKMEGKRAEDKEVVGVK